MKSTSQVKKAVMIGGMCSASYLAVYIARNILGSVSPQMIASGGFTTENIGTLSSIYFISYALGQLVNGRIGDKIHAKYMISLGLALAGVCNLLLPILSGAIAAVYVTYALTGFFLSMIYGPMTKLVAENTEPIYATRCSLGYTFASFFGSPLAGILAALLSWQGVFFTGSGILIFMGMVCFAVFSIFEKKGIVQYGLFKTPQEKGGGIRLLLKHKIVKFTLISIITGVIRTTVVFWMPTYFSQYLGFSPENAALLFTVATFIISMTAFVAILLYECLGRDMERTVLVCFVMAAVCFLLVFTLKHPLFNVGFLVLGIMASNSAATMLWSRYCPSLRDTGMVSGATGFLDFMSYMAASASSQLFANAVSVIGWGKLILVWFGLMIFGIIIALPYGNFRKKLA